MTLTPGIKTLLLISICTTAGIKAQDDDRKEIVEEASACLSRNSLSIQCPDDHMVVLRSAMFSKTKEPGCNPESAGTTCELEDVRSDWFSTCYGKSRCDLPLKLSPSHASCHGYRGEPFLRVSYRCEVFIGDSYLTHSRDICNMGSVWEGALLFLYSPGFPRWNQESDCGCSVTVHSKIQLEITLTRFQSSEKTSADCGQVFRIQSGTEEMKMCSEDHERDYKPLDIEYDNNVYFKFENTARTNYMFLLVLQVHHEQNVTVQCQRDYALPALPTTTESGVIISQNQRSPKEKDTIAMHWPIITGIVAVLCVTLTVSTAVLLFCRRQNKKRRGSDKNLAFDNDTYMTREQASSPQNQIIINMSNIDKVHAPKHKEITSQKSSTPALAPPVQKSDKQASGRPGKEEMGLQTEASLPRDIQGTIVASSGQIQAKHPSLSNLGGKTLAELRKAYPDIPESVLKELGFQSEATIAITNPNLKDLKTTENTRFKAGEKVATDLNKNTPKKEQSTSPFDRSHPQHSSLTKLGAASVTDQATLDKNRLLPKADKESFLGSCESTDVTPYSSMTDLSVKDKAKLMTEQLKTAKD